ncbi:galactosyltransferase-related protein [Runella slithyformis]|uniref:Galactosyltransferase C-terminal domain-containing protein n=1 Tax=Runella slithyformis (strain ATCC 29530 / DSM 19594 / LMG 11500 / NCIMB 11436 / LSU 4) TaxID=761193 RepID=A0A7U3ZHM3_RUNSL|nr:galactosyltransferase-related protein [Runella slithyformis]AEI47387.1 hypothetical protein Runsl_0953 [Runella slithyformis DSM 19594]
MASKIDLTDITFLIPLRIDSLERLENIIVCTSFLLKYFKTNIVICEADNENTGLLRKALSPEIRTFFVKDSNPSFHRTYYINELVRISTTPFVAIWDTDVLVEPEQIAVSVDSLRKNIYDFIYPYDGRFIDTGVVYRRLFIDRLDINVLKSNTLDMEAPYTHNACGGGFIARREAYVQAGMENENFTSWGPEDGERLKRWRTLEMRIGWVKGEMFHLYHSRGINSRFKSDKEKKRLIIEADRIGDMSKKELEEEVLKWNNKIMLRKSAFCSKIGMS